MPVEKMLSELEVALRTILACELQMPEAELELDRPFAEMGMNSLMAMSIRREAEQLVGIELSATMLWNHPTIASLAGYLAKQLSPQEDSEDDVDVLPDSTSSVLTFVRQHGIDSCQHREQDLMRTEFSRLDVTG